MVCTYLLILVSTNIIKLKIFSVCLFVYLTIAVSSNQRHDDFCILLVYAQISAGITSRIGKIHSVHDSQIHKE